jgi:sugar phosphate permease
MMRISFGLSATLFLCMLVAPNRYVSILFLLLALMCMSCSSALLWSIYIPSLGKTGKVSSVNGILDCTGYVAAALANKLFASVMANVGWSTVFVLWASLGIIGILSTLFVKNKKSQ